jgi:hypothetical protein
MRLDEEKLEALRSWGERLRKSGGEESAAVGRAILMLVEEIDRLHMDLWHARLEPEPAGSGVLSTAGTVEEEDEEQPVASSLHARLHRVLRRDSSPAAEPAEEPRPDADPESSASPQAWIDALRHQK